MVRLFREWAERYLSDPQAIVLALLLLVGTVIILTLGRILAPVLAAVVIAYILEALVAALGRVGLPRTIAVLIVFLVFVVFLFVLLFWLLPLLSRQVGQLVAELPSMITYVQGQLMRLPESYPGIISEEQVATLIRVLAAEAAAMGQHLLSISLAWVRGAITMLVYLIIVPFLVFFFLKDKEAILSWVLKSLPEKHALSEQVWREVNRQMGRYVRGKFLEILIVWAASGLTFHVLGLDFAMLNGFMVGLSVLVPYVGAIVAAFPVTMMAYFQWGASADTLYVVVAYWAIQLLDGNVLALFLLSGVVNLHPAVTIVSVVVFGGLWGLWGVFFAIPLATLIQAVLRAWPQGGGGGEPAAGAHGS